MAQYEADKIIHLLRFCSWKAQTEMAHNGLLELNAKLCNLIDNDEQLPNEKYLVDLLSNARMAARKDNILTKRKHYIDLLLRFAGFDSWTKWKNALYAAGEYLHVNGPDTTTNSNVKLAIWIPAVLEKHLTRPLDFIRSNDLSQLQTILSKEENPVGTIKHLLTQLESATFIIAAIPLTWKHLPAELQHTEWLSLLQSGRIIPVWIDTRNPWDTTPPFIEGLKQSLIIGGIPGILTTLLFFHGKLSHSDDPDGEVNPKTLSGSPASVQHFHDNSLGFFHQGNGNQNYTVQNVEKQYIGKE